MSEGGLDQETFDAEEKAAVLEGKLIVRSTPTTLLLDLDTPEDIQRYQDWLPWLIEKHIAISVEEVWASKTEGHMHAVVRLTRPFSFEARVALQLSLGSDRRREVLSLLRHANGIDEPCRLYRPAQLPF